MHKQTTPCPTIVKLFFYIYIKTNLDFYLQDDTGTQAIVYTRWHVHALPQTYKTNALDSVMIVNQR